MMAFQLKFWPIEGTTVGHCFQSLEISVLRLLFGEGGFEIIIWCLGLKLTLNPSNIMSTEEVPCF